MKHAKEFYSNESLDSIDIQILQELQNNAKLTIKELATAINLSPSPTFERQRRLEREGYIQRYTAQLNPEILGNTFIVFCSIRLKQHNKELGLQFKEAIEEMDEITECYNISGEYDFLTKIYVRDMAHYQNFVLNTLGNIENIAQLHSIFVIGEIKRNVGIPLPKNHDTL